MSVHFLVLHAPGIELHAYASLPPDTQGKRSEAQLLRLNASDPGSADPTGTGPRGLYPLLWLLRGDACAMRALRKTDAGADKVRLVLSLCCSTRVA